MSRKVGNFSLALFLGLSLVVASVTRGVQASDMAVNMCTATGDTPMPGGCSGCSGDDGMPMACFALCGNVLAILPFAPTITADVSVSPPAPHTIPVAGLHGPPDPYPPRPTILG